MRGLEIVWNNYENKIAIFVQNDQIKILDK